jgi:hypothetical protein
MLQCIMFFEVQAVTVKFAVDLGSGLRRGEVIVPFLWPVTDVFQLKIQWAEVQSCFCACEIIQLFTLVLCMVTALREFEFMLVINENNYVIHWQRLFFFDRISVLSLDHRRDY